MYIRHTVYKYSQHLGWWLRMTQLPTFGSPVIHQYNASYLPKAQAGPAICAVGGGGGGGAPASGSFVNQYHSGTSLPPKGQNNCKI